MIKKHTTLALDNDIINKAKQSGLNMSEIAEKAIRAKLEIKQVEIDNSILKCEKCGREQEKATLNNPKGMMWVCPYKLWLCWQCLREEIKIIESTVSHRK